jgi:hypothetical protein
MRQIGLLHPTDVAVTPPDTVLTMLIAASSGQASDWLSSGSTATANAAVANVHLVRVSAQTTAGAAFSCFVNLQSTGAAVPSTGLQVGSSTVHPVIGDDTPGRIFQVPGNSTGFSVAALSSGYVQFEMWHK